MGSEKAFVNQGVIIAHLNQYLQSHNLPVRMNESGICNGLASMHIKYAVQGKEGEFFSMLHRMSAVTQDTALDLEINHFVTDIVVSLFPDEFDKERGQLRSLETLSIDGEPLKTLFELGMVTHQDNWAEIIQELDLKDNESMKVGNAIHSVSVSKKNGTYRLYDPEYDEGFKTFDSEAALVKELHDNVFRYDTNEALGMFIQLTRNPSDTSNRQFPKVREIYAKYLNTSNVDQAVIVRGKHINTLDFAVQFNNDEVVDQLFKMGSKANPLSLAEIALYRNDNPACFAKMLDRILDTEKAIPSLFVLALQAGRKNAFDVLKQHAVSRPYFNDIFIERNAALLIQHAASGGNITLLKDVIDHYQSIRLTDKTIADNIATKAGTSRGFPIDAIEGAIYGGHVACVELLVNRLAQETLLTQEKLVTYLVAAINQNKPHLVDFFVETINKNTTDRVKQDIFNGIKIHARQVERTDLSILRTLKSSGVNFSSESQGIFKTKENKPIGRLLSMGIRLDRFMDYMRAQLSSCQAKISSMKEAMQNLRASATTPDQKEKKDGPLVDDGHSP
ncbi:MAG: hypothetical protein K0U37_03310 [Gammaproteobacteria bacterium]|nr:hypothetical protein [Gammaproteobacteria bacterium]